MNHDPSPYETLLGYGIVDWTAGRARLDLPVRPEHLNRARVLHGGVLTSLLDSALGYAACYCPRPGRVRRCVTLSLTVSFVGQASAGLVRAEGRVIGGGRKIITATGEARDESGALLATAQGVFRYRAGSEDESGVALEPTV